MVTELLLKKLYQRRKEYLLKKINTLFLKKRVLKTIRAFFYNLKTITVLDSESRNKAQILFMGNDIMAYIQKLELFGFFSGYCLLYSVIFSFKSGNNGKAQTLFQKLVILLPYAYALTATLYLGMVIKNISLDFSMRNFNEQFHIPFLQILALLGVLFWVPFFSKKTFLSLLHSLVFFFFLLKDIFFELNLPEGKETIQNDMRLFTDSLLLNFITLAFISLIYFFFIYLARNRKHTS